ncbi:cupredoxin domain-containing protein [Candidatus Woesebacteria bacterium]|nr:cupredoxin domain-containing protein [Candidatus Woesebacteria bacterium]
MKVNSRIILILVLVFILGGIIAYLQKGKLAPSYKSPNGKEAEMVNEVTVEVVAKDNKFEPNEFKIGLQNTLNLNVNAIDRDYTFRVEGYKRLDANFPKGKTTTIKIEFLGVGEYPFSCGTGCSGKITIEPSTDTEG